ncbi:hypothetical protein SLEP1_g57998 [Rubroshorea leprosula]|uniref:Uncharacterized protein n=1 Tax=Rubroshorea leprosula TaxID=152421 RepID=A0AAV5MP55_9ROSI|nr:hypothetical protein SLEP1_g57998 [Rubroshorea leprosula]
MSDFWTIIQFPEWIPNPNQLFTLLQIGIPNPKLVIIIFWEMISLPFEPAHFITHAQFGD